jgi:hypothetical protein
MFESHRLGFHSAIGAGGRHLISFIILQSFLYTDVRDLVCWLQKLSPPIVLQFLSVHAPPQYFTAYFLVTSLRLSIVLGVYVAVVICMGDGDGMVIEVPDDGQS